MKTFAILAAAALVSAEEGDPFNACETYEDCLDEQIIADLDAAYGDLLDY